MANKRAKEAEVVVPIRTKAPVPTKNHVPKAKTLSRFWALKFCRIDPKLFALKSRNEWEDEMCRREFIIDRLLWKKAIILCSVVVNVKGSVMMNEMFVWINESLIVSKRMIFIFIKQVMK